MPLTEVQAQDYWKSVVKLLNETEAYASEAAQNYRALWNSVAALNLGETQAAGSSALATNRGRLSDILSPNAVASVLTAPLAEYSGALATPEGVRITLEQAIFRLRESFIAGNKTIKTRGFTFGAAVAGGSNVGTGAILRCTVDEDGFALESGHPEIKTFLCRQDQQQVEKHEEVFDVSGAEREPDFLLVSGTGPQGSISTIGPRASDRILLNQSFSSFAFQVTGADVAAASVNDFAGWVLGSFSGVYASLLAFRDRAGESDNRKLSIRFDTDNSLTQYLGRARRPRFADRTPYVIGVRVYKPAAVTAGTVTLSVGPSNVTLDLAAAPAGWNSLQVTLDKRVYSKNFTQNDIRMVISLAGLTTSGQGPQFDDATFTEMGFLDGTFWSVLGGGTSYLKKDIYTVTDTLTPASEGLLSKWTHHRSGALVTTAPGFCLPTSGTPTIADPV